MVKIDEFDKKLLLLLQEDSSRTIKELSKQLGLSTTPTFNRVRRLEENGIIKGYSAIINPEKIGKKLYAFIQVSLKEHTKKKVSIMMDRLIKMPEILECHYVTGGADLLLKVLVNDMESYNYFITEKLFGVSNIARIESLLSLSSRKHVNIIPVD